MNKRTLHHYWTKLRKISIWHLLILFAVFGLMSALALRHNNLTALHLRDQVISADEKNGDVEGALRKLRVYVYGHMNTDLASSTSVYPPIQLKYRYQRLLDAQNAQVKATNDQIYTDAQKHCEALMPTGVSLNRVPCIQQYLDAHQLAKTTSVPDALYKFDFVSPSWSPDLAGWSLVLTAFFGLLLAVRFMLERWLRHRFKSHF